ncbi:hypothetical protein B4N89_39485 [Embleya scabrispora]|uniref:PET hydrolase/cutinase-like domain-containing protein n=2 Tax=Embleya scabrispora TaxID=159449 RepID=A0A1T3NND9_9ACTN|nr:hypothetical protein B4N89_39485 [Embleya scabrispora]
MLESGEEAVLGVARRSVARLVLLVALLSAIVATVASPVAALPARGRPPRVEVPEPTGSSAVGTKSLWLVDRSRSDPWNPAVSARELMVSVWYPTAGASRARAPYMSAALSRVVFGSDALAGVRTRAFLDAPPRRRSAPLVVVSPGFGGSRTSLTASAEELASHGYVVAVVDHTYEAPVEFPDGRLEPCRICVGIPDDARVVRTRAADIGFVIDRLTAPDAGLSVDARRIGVFGHSMGGAAAVEALRTDRRIDAAVDLDGNFWTEPPAAGIDRPVLLLGAQRVRTGTPDANWQGMWDRLTGPRRWLDVPAGGHYTFCDMPWIVDRFGIRDGVPPDEAAWQYGTLGGDRATAITRAYVRAFLDRHLRGRPGNLLDRPSRAYPEIRFVG